ncbi:MAG: ferrochelatase [Alphaproteobacteria bacterium]|nr:ferrochelatase [Alphaproteobacteria bacterium]
MTRTAVVLFNLGGPDSSAAVKPFLFNLFYDRAIIDLANPLRWALARIIAGRRAPVTRQIYAQIGNASPLRANTRAQAEALRAALGDGYRVFIAMRYWHPRAGATAAEVKAWQPDEIVLLPLYPQFSGTTSASSIADWRAAAARIGLKAKERIACCYPTGRGFVAALARGVADELARVPAGAQVRVLLSAHGLPLRALARGDPYQWQIEATAAAVRAAVGQPALDMRVCYQSRVGPLKWLSPSTEHEIRQAGSEGAGVVVVPIAFVSEHSETLVELDRDYRKLAREAGVPFYRRAPTVGTAPEFIAGLADLVRAAPLPGAGRRACPEGFRQCPAMAAP